MNWLNYHHLLYFWKVAKEGSIARASVELRLASPTISVQIHQLEDMLGQKLFQREGRGLVLTEVGRVAFRYADAIFAQGDALMRAMATDAGRHTIRLVVGLSSTVPKTMVQRLLIPVLAMEPAVLVTFSMDRSPDEFLCELAAGVVDVVLIDRVAPATSALRVFSHPLGESGTVFLASANTIAGLAGEFPESLRSAPFLFPGIHAAARTGLDAWCDGHHIEPKIVAEMDDVALSAVFAASDRGVVAVPQAIEADLAGCHRLQVVGSAPEVRHAFFAWSLEQKIRHPAVIALCAAARLA